MISLSAFSVQHLDLDVLTLQALPGWRQFSGSFDEVECSARLQLCVERILPTVAPPSIAVCAPAAWALF
jgi:hypothetical protein